MKYDTPYKPWIIGGCIAAALLFYIGKLASLQIFDTQYGDSATSNVLRHVTQYPARGLIYDRNGRLLVYNEPVYDIMVTPRAVSAFDTAELCTILGLDIAQARAQLRAAQRHSRLKPSIFLKQVSNEDYAQFAEKSHRFPGFYAQTRTMRRYPERNSAHLLGYVGEITDRQIKEDPYYKSGDYIGVNGLEKAYERELRGEKGAEILMVDVHNRVKGKYNQGRDDRPAIPGRDIQVTIDAGLQSYGEKLMDKKRGAIIALEPATGEILCMISAPSFDPNLLSGRQRGANYQELQKNPYNPLFNRALQAQYPPGSTFKLVNALIGLQTGVLTERTAYPCHMGYHAGRFRLGCHSHKSPLGLVESISNSCNAYYCYAYRSLLDRGGAKEFRANFAEWGQMSRSLGLGRKLDLDFPFELPGLIPDTTYYDKRYRRNGWHSLMVVSNSIGQGEILATPLQIANLACVVANRGHYLPPHFVKRIEGRASIDSLYLRPRTTMIDTAHFAPVVEGMRQAVNAELGATARIAQIPGVEVCGKTGTAQNPHGKDHSIFIAFAPKDDPKIAVAVYVENAGFGATWSAPIASLVIERYLNGEVDKSRQWLEDRIVNKDLIHEPETPQ